MANVPGPITAVTAPPVAARQPAQLWLALQLPELIFAACYASKPLTNTPRLVFERQGRAQQVRAVCPRARALGIVPGMTLAAALAVAPELEAEQRAVRRERALLETIASGGFAFTSWVSLEPPDAVLLEVKGSLQLFGGAAALAAAASARCAELTDVRPQLALAPTPLAALALARGLLLHSAVTPLLTDAAQLTSELGSLPLGVLRWSAEIIERLATMGVRSIAEVLRLPRAGFARRFGKAQLLALDRLMGRSAEPRAAFLPRERFAARCEPGFELNEQSAVLRATLPLLAQLEQFLRRRQCGVSALHFTLLHRAPAAALHAEGSITRVSLRLAAPELAAERFAALLEARLEQVALPAAVIRIELRSGPSAPLAPQSASLWRPGEHGGAAGNEAPAFIEHLRARLGVNAVYGLCLVSAHRPEAAWAVAEPRPPGQASANKNSPPAVCADQPHVGRPLWLLRTPEMLAVDADNLAAACLHLLTGPERIETGWWDGNDILRDYYVVRDAADAELWVFREREAPHRWFLQGVFG